MLFGDGAGVEEGQELADLHGHALHVAEHGDVALWLAGEAVELALLVAGQLPATLPMPCRTARRARGSPRASRPRRMLSPVTP